MNVNTIFPSKYVKASDLGDKLVTVTIKSAVMEELGHGAEKERKLVIYFERATKGLILNRTNAMIIASMYTPETDNWIGHAVILYSMRVKAFGAWHEAVRVKEQIPSRNVGAARMPEAMTETPPIDDENDLLDVDESDMNATIDPDTGEIGSPLGAGDPTLWEKDAPVTAKPNRLSPAQMARIHILGADVHGKRWDAERPALVSEVTNGAGTSCKELTPDEAQVLIRQLETELKHARNGKVTA